MGTGKYFQYDDVINRFENNGIDLKKYRSVRVSEYIYDMNIVMSAADLVVCRAGASTLSELTALGKPSNTCAVSICYCQSSGNIMPGQ